METSSVFCVPLLNIPRVWRMDIRIRTTSRSAIQAPSHMKSQKIRTPTKVRLLKALVWSVATYWCEGWTVCKEDHWRIETLKIRRFRRLLRVSYGHVITQMNGCCLKWTRGQKQQLRSINGRTKSGEEQFARTVFTEEDQ